MKTAMREKQWAQKYPELGTAPLPTDPYVSEEYFALERDRVFRRAWINVGRTDEVPGAGDYFVRDVDVCKVSVLVIRGSDGVVRGFHNVCSHRSNKLVLDERGSCPGSLNCHFHNWVYSDKGKLVRVPDEENFFDLDKRDHGLTPIELDTWEGFIFVHLGPEPAVTLREFLGGVADQLDGFPFHEMRAIQTWRVEERANWKVALDAQNELYHFPYMHRRVLGNIFAMNDKGQCRYQDVSLYGHHCVWACEYHRSLDLTPLKVALYSAGMVTRELRVPQMIGEMDFVVLFPNFVNPCSTAGRSQPGSSPEAMAHSVIPSSIRSLRPRCFPAIPKKEPSSEWASGLWGKEQAIVRRRSIPLFMRLDGEGIFPKARCRRASVPSSASWLTTSRAVSSTAGGSARPACSFSADFTFSISCASPAEVRVGLTCATRPSKSMP